MSEEIIAVVPRIHDLEAVNERLFGWKWMAFHGHPIREGGRTTPPPTRVRIFVGPQYIADPDWGWLGEATGEEPLAYCYCSSSGSPIPPVFRAEDDIKVLNHIKKRWRRRSPEYKKFVELLPSPIDYEPGHYCEAAMCALDQTEDVRTEYEKR